MAKGADPADYSSWSPETLRVAQVVAALTQIAVRDLPIVFGDKFGLTRAAVDEGALAIRDGYLTPVDESAVTASLMVLSERQRRGLHAELARKALSKFDVARQSDLAMPQGVNETLVRLLETVANDAERAGRSGLALEFWSRAVARTAKTQEGRLNREIRVAELACMAGDFALSVEILLGVSFDELDLGQICRVLNTLATALNVLWGMEGTRLRLERLKSTLPVGHDGRFVFDLFIAGLRDNYDEVQLALEKVVPDLLAGRYPLALTYSSLTLLLEAKVNTGAGLDSDILKTLTALEKQQPPAQLEDSVATLEAHLGYQVEQVNMSRRHMPRLLAKAEVAGEQGFVDILLVHAAHADTIVGRFSSARDRLTRSRALALRPAGAPANVRAHGLLALEVGCDADVREAIALPHRSGREAIGRLNRSGLQGLLLSHHGHHASAIEHLEACVRESSAIGIHEPGRRLWADVELALCYAQTGSAAKALAIAQELSALSSRTGRRLPEVQAHRVRAWVAELEGDARAVRKHVRHVIVDGQDMEWLPERARHLAEAHDLLGRSAPDDELQRSLTRRATAVLDVLEEGTARRMLKAQLDAETLLLSNLTSAERRVVETVGRGLSNKAASEKLFLSPRTVESHLHSAFLKLGLSSRGELIARMNSRSGSGDQRRSRSGENQ